MAIDDKVPNEKVIAQMQLLSAAPQELIVPDEFVTTDIFDLVALEENTPSLMWRLECLNKSIGPLKKGTFGSICARLETGKTAMWVSEVANFISQINDTEHAVIFFNEENGTDVMWRLYTAVTGLTGNELEADLKKAKKLFYDAGGQRIKFVDRARQTHTSIYKTLDTLNPRVIVIDNLDKIKGFVSERKDMELGSIYEWARATAKTYAPVIGVSQANADGYNTKWLTELDMANSKTAKPAELDFLICIGKTNEAGYEYTRYLNIPKNKRKHNRYANEKDRHGKWVVRIIPELSRYEDVK
jgi:replicative DNA helicase